MIKLPNDTSVDYKTLQISLDKRFLSSSYKLLWFSGILKETSKKNRGTSIGKLSKHMIVSAWHLVINHGLSLGLNDKINEIIAMIQHKYGLTKDLGEEELYSILENTKDPEIVKGIRNLSRYVPYRFLSPFYQNELTGLPENQKNKRIADLSETTKIAPYKVSMLTEAILINKDWFEYILKHQQVIQEWLNQQLVVYLSSVNPDIKETEYIFISDSSSNRKGHSLNENLSLQSPPARYKGRPAKRSITPFDRLRKKVLKEFNRKKLIGDISLNDIEYDLLINYFIDRTHAILQDRIRINEDELLTLAMVAIGIRYYDGGYWNHTARILNVTKLYPYQRNILRNVFLNTLKKYEKPVMPDVEFIQNILMHGFVSNSYSDEMFDFLFKYYNLDLERNLERNTGKMMDNLIDTISRQDNTGRTYLLVRQTAYAINSNISAGKARIRRLLRLIDRCFWEQVTPVNPRSRLTMLFKEWQENSPEFKREMQLFNEGSLSIKGRKRYSSPYLYCDMMSTDFSIKLPAQLIPGDREDKVKWRIEFGGHEHILEVGSRQVVTGRKTESATLHIEQADIWDLFILELFCDDNRIIKYRINEDTIRFFDFHGNYLNADSLPQGEVYSYTQLGEYPLSDALVESETTKGIVRSWFNLSNGDIIRLPGGKPVSVGRHLNEGLVGKSLVVDASAEIDSSDIPVYYEPPSFILKMLESKAPGCAIMINGNRHRLFDYETVLLDINERSGERGFWVHLNDYGCKENGVYQIDIDVPGDNRSRVCKFVLINGFAYTFEDAPYIYQPRGTIRFPEGIEMVSKGFTEKRNPDENSFNFTIEQGVTHLSFDYKTPSESIAMKFLLPVFQWCVSNGDWQIEKPGDCWHSKFPTIVRFRFPAETLKVEAYSDTQSDYRYQSFKKRKDTGIFESDLTRIPSWFDTEQDFATVYLDFSENRFEWMNVITKSTLVSKLITGNFKEDQLVGELEIIGEAEYFVDVVNLETSEVIADKAKVKNGRFVINGTFNSGKYQVTLLEKETDEYGFDVDDYILVDRFIHKLLNPHDLERTDIKVSHIKRSSDSLFQNKILGESVIRNLKRVENSKNKYLGQMRIGALELTVEVDFFNPERLQYVYLTFHDGYDFVEFLFDTHQKIIVTDEQTGLSKKACYRRYISLYPEDYVFTTEFL